MVNPLLKELMNRELYGNKAPRPVVPRRPPQNGIIPQPLSQPPRPEHTSEPARRVRQKASMDFEDTVTSRAVSLNLVPPDTVTSHAAALHGNGVEQDDMNGNQMGY